MIKKDELFFDLSEAHQSIVEAIAAALEGQTYSEIDMEITLNDGIKDEIYHRNGLPYTRTKRRDTKIRIQGHPGNTFITHVYLPNTD